MTRPSGRTTTARSTYGALGQGFLLGRPGPLDDADDVDDADEPAAVEETVRTA